MQEKPQTETIEDLIKRRSDFLREYQNEAYAQRYRESVERVRAAEASSGGTALTEAVAKSLFKLMAYKDEYEVARLHTARSFQDKLKEQFEGDFKINYHLAPPFLAAEKDGRGRPVKRAFGPWMTSAFRVLAAMRSLRGTAFDLFGYTEERRMERELIEWYQGIIETILQRLPLEGPEKLIALAAAPMDMRGYGPVKEAAVKQVREKVAALLAST